MKVKEGLDKLIKDTKDEGPEVFSKKYNEMILELQNDLGAMAPSPIVSLAAEAVADRQRRDDFRKQKVGSPDGQ